MGEDLNPQCAQKQKLQNNSISPPVGFEPTKAQDLIVISLFSGLSAIVWYCVWLQEAMKMKKMIDELWDGEISPQDTLISDNQEYRELQHQQSKNKAELLEVLSDEQKELLETVYSKGLFGQQG